MRFLLCLMAHCLTFHQGRNSQLHPVWQGIQEADQKKRCDTTILSTILHMIDCTPMATVLVIYDDSIDECTLNVVNTLSVNGRVRIYDEGLQENGIQQLLLDALHENTIDAMRSNLNLVIMCSVESISRSLRIGQIVDIKYGKKSTLRHFSQWILVPTDVSTNALPQVSVVFDNVVLLTRNQSTNRTEVFTLLWKPDGREWEDVTSTVSTSSCTVISLFPNRQRGLNGRRLTVVALEWAPFSIKVKHKEQTYYTGISDEMMDYLSRKLNFTYCYVEPLDLQWGTLLENNSWTGIIGVLQKEEADLSSVPYAFSPERSKVMEYTYPTLLSHVAAVYKKHENNNRSWTSLVSCFKWEVYCVGAAVFVTVLGLYVFLNRFIPTTFHDVDDAKDITQQFMATLAVPLGQGIIILTSLSSGRILFSSWCLFGIIMTAVYRGNLIAFLTVDKTVIPFRTVEELANQDLYEVGGPRDNFGSNTLQKSNITTYQKLWAKMKATHEKSPTGYAAEQAYLLRRLHEGRFVFLESYVTTDLILNKGCDISSLKEKFLYSRASIVFPLRSPLAKLFYKEILRTVENGLYEKWYTNWMPRKPPCENSLLGIGVNSLRIQEYYSVIAVCGCGIFGAVIVLLVEHCLANLRVGQKLEKGDASNYM